MPFVCMKLGESSIQKKRNDKKTYSLSFQFLYLLEFRTGVGLLHTFGSFIIVFLCSNVGQFILCCIKYVRQLTKM